MTPLQDPVASAPSNWVRTHLNLSAPTPRTLRFLRAVLGLASFDECESKATCASTKKARQVKGSSISRPPIRHATRNRQKPGAVIQIHETNDEEIPRLSETERRKIATDTFNSTLKCLGETAKALREAPASKTESSVNPNDGPLQERSPNKERKKPALDSKKSTICNAPMDSGLLADLSYSALLFLRRSDHKDVVSTAGNNAGLENAALILLDRSISLNLIEQAQRQLCDIHERYWGDEVRKKSSSQSNIARLLLGRPDAADEDRRFRFTASLQSQALRLALLVGPKCIDSELLKSLQPDAIGSPAWVTSRALEKQLLTSEQSGLQLRTISLALSKLYALATSSKGENSSPLDLFKLFCLSLRIKFESWVHSGHLPDPPTEVWRPLHRAIKQLFATTKDPKASAAYTFEALGSIQKLTRRIKCEFHTPPDLIGTLLQIIRDPDEYPQLIALVEERLRQTSGASHLILRCQITLSRLRASSGSTKTLESLKSMGSALAEPGELPPADLDKFLLLLAQLRKAAAELIWFDKTRPHMEANGPSIDFQTTLIRFTYCSFNFLRRHIRSILILSSENSSVEKRKAFLTTLLKTIDAVLSAEQFAITQDADMVAAASEALEDCSAAVQTLQVECAALMTQCRLETSLTQLRVRISQLFWARYLEAVKESKTPSEQSRILGMSLLGLLDLPLADQKVAHVALKYERLAACYLEERDFRPAETALRTAIEISIKDGVLGDVAHLLLSASFHRAWSHSDLGCKALGRVLTTYSKAILDHTSISESGSESQSFYDDPALPSLHRAVLLEKQLLAMVDLGMNDHGVDLCATMANTLLSLLPQPVYQVYSMRVINQLLQLALKKKVPASTSVINSSVIRRILDADHAAENVFLSRYEPELRSLLSLQYGFLTGVLSNQTVLQGVKQLCEIVQTCKTHQETHVKCLDVGAYIAPLLLSVEYAAILGNYDVSLMALEALQHLVELGVPIQEISYKRILLRKGQFHDLLKDPQSAQKAFATIEDATQEESDPLFETELALTYSEHHLYAEDLDASNKWLVIARNAWQARESSGNSKSTKARLREQIMWCRAAHLASRLAFESSQLVDAIVLARQSAKISATIWSSIERVCASTAPAHSNGLLDHELHCVSFELSRLDLSSPPSVRLTSSAVVLGSEVSLCCSVFSYMAFLNAHCGVYQDAVMFYEQTLKIARRWGHSIHTIIALSELGLLHARAGQIEKAQNSLQELPQIARDYHASWIRGHVALNQVETCLILGDGSAASRRLIEAKQLPVDKEPASVELTVSGPLKDRSVCASAKPTGRKRGVKGQKGSAQIKRPPKECPSASKSTLDLSGFNARISFLESRLQIFLGGADPADRFDTSLLCDKDDDSRKTTSIALSLVHSALRSFSEDSIHNVLAETAVAIPDQDQKKSSRQKQAAKTFKDGTALLLQAYDILWELLIQISLLSSALNQPLVSSSSNVVLNMTTPLDVALTRERFVTLGELSAAKKMSTESWPSTHNSDNSHICLMSDKLLNYDTSLLPASWSVISLGLNEDGNELFVAQLAYQRSPFVVRIPLARPDPSEGDNEELDLKSAKAEIQEIIMKANASAHDARGSSVDKSVRKEWYVERQALDRQLATLLENIENIWFGGFRGLLSAGHIEEGELRQFGRCLTSTLHRHLPSRQKPSKSCEHVVELHDHVLELFVALGHPRAVELEDAVTDLLYFVIDILQFNGERNAYDEIDFDAMLVEVLDALHSYHDRQSSASRDKRGHVILVLDKELQAFPWESLSCLKNQGVSRMPSIASVWEKLKAIEDQRHDLKGYMIPRTDGAYILNPSSDLVATQETFGQIFENQLSNYRAIVNRHPEGNEFETALRDSSLMLYFGHGGGGQYIRPRTIRKMDKCAVTLLMGCSSAKMTECGVYEPHGMPLSYLSAGSPAVVGTLWDVTDRDIDRFAMELMADWGLIDADANSGVPTLNKSRNPKAGKENAARHQCGRQKSGQKSLDEAVAHARDACLLKYLNGAAPVMYGIPVFLG
ncbi:hypothetical protein AYO20_04600 [Fonsecaea nubica]|uniref:separase n=1 Tax=Fonsecaea nubica TaxID=856822 RepID=A0A178D374_9EURO|nr:hypothetical protein AYO20_04600 [Fonsecaea nubica]OAL36186.1 hypothetical protein AYO20_04600 [Fonsecaea nubica]